MNGKRMNRQEEFLVRRLRTGKEKEEETEGD
jgi:hypothetical protein